MARTRRLSPGFFKNEDLLERDPMVRLLFAGLPCLADREGKLEDRPKRIKIELFPGDDFDVQSALDELEEDALVVRYTVNQGRYLALPKFNVYQAPHKNEAASVIPDPPGWMRDSEGGLTLVVAENDQSSSHSPLYQGQVQEQGLDQVQGSSRARPGYEAHELFDHLYSQHPIPINLDKAKAALFKIELADLEEVRRQHDLHVERWKDTDPGFIPELHNWLAKDTWRQAPRPLPAEKVNAADARAAELLREAGIA